jgi:small-conductance mechanosensitive channel
VVVILDTIVFGNVTLFDLLFALIVVIIAVLIGKGISINLRRALKGKISKNLLRNLVRIVNLIAIIFALIIILPILGINPMGLIVAGGIVALVIGFATQNILSNLVAGLFLMIERPIKIGDSVNIDGTSGVVEDVRIISTTIRTYDGLYVRIPNESVFTTKITNYNINIVRRFEYTIRIRYRDDAEKAFEIIENLIDDHSFTLKNPAPEIFVENLGDSSVNINIKIWTPASENWNVKTELLWKIKKALEAEGIQIPFPQREVWFKNVPKTT